MKNYRVELINLYLKPTNAIKSLKDAKLE